MSFEIGLELASNNQDLSALTPFLKEKDRKPEIQVPCRTGDRRTRKINIIGDAYNDVPFAVDGIFHLYKSKVTRLVNDCSIVCILNVPPTVTPGTFRTLMGPHLKAAANMTVIHDQITTRFIFKFDSTLAAKLFYTDFNEKPFGNNCQLCYCVYIEKLFIISGSDNYDCNLLLELPSCPACLDLMDLSVTGSTSKSNSTSSSFCPCCSLFMAPLDGAKPYCSDCGSIEISRENFWICLICSHMACGRYIKKHAYSHFIDTKHTFALEISTQRIWDYTRDEYVHRVSLNSGPKYLPAVTYAEKPAVDPVEHIRKSYESLIESINVEHIAQIHSITEKLTEITGKTRILSDENKELQARLMEINERYLVLESVADASQEIHKKKVDKLTGKVAQLAKVVDEEKALNFQLHINVADSHEKMINKQRDIIKLKLDNTNGLAIKDANICDLKCTIEDLNEQVRDLMFFLDTQSKVSTDPTLSDLRDGYAFVENDCK